MHGIIAFLCSKPGEYATWLLMVASCYGVIAAANARRPWLAGLALFGVLLSGFILSVNWAAEFAIEHGARL